MHLSTIAMTATQPAHDTEAWLASLWTGLPDTSSQRLPAVYQPTDVVKSLTALIIMGSLR